jgi:hypothetical protein
VVRWVLIALAIIAIAAAGWFLIGRLFPSNPPGPTKNEKRADSLAATKANDQALLDSSNARIRSRGVESGTATRTAQDAQDRATRAKRRADSLAIARAWEGAYRERTAEAADLRVTVAGNAIVIANLKADTTDLRSQLGIVNRRLEKTEAVVVGLRWDLQQARKCKIAGFINCPSRIQTVALTAVAFFAVDRYQRR